MKGLKRDTWKIIGELKKAAIDAYMRNEVHKGKWIGRFAQVGETYRTFSNYFGGDWDHRNSSRRDWEKMEERLGKLLPVIREVVEALAMIQIDNT